MAAESAKNQPRLRKRQIEGTTRGAAQRKEKIEENTRAKAQRKQWQLKATNKTAEQDEGSNKED